MATIGRDRNRDPKFAKAIGMEQNVNKISLPETVRYIKLGSGGNWEQECLTKGIIRMGFGTESGERFLLCQNGDWPGLNASFIAEGKERGTAARFTKELRLFFEDPGTMLWITFMNECLCWGHVDGSPAQLHADGDGVWRTIAGGWRNTDVNGELLIKEKLSGALTKLAAYRGTSCDVDVASYVIRRINGEKMPEVERTSAALHELQSTIPALMQMLTPGDFELLVELIFSTSGWRRESVTGGTQDTKDIGLWLPSTDERAFVQVKSRTTPKELATYIEKFRERSDSYKRMFYVYHTGSLSSPNDPRVTLIGPEQLARLVVDAGLVNWLIDKTS